MNFERGDDMEPNRTWSGLLVQIRDRAAIFLGSENLQALHHFCNGIGFAKNWLEVSAARWEIVDDFPWSDFEKYIEERHNRRRISLNSFGLAQFVAQGQDIEHFDLGKEYAGAWNIWWQWFDDFNHSISTIEVVD